MTQNEKFQIKRRAVCRNLWQQLGGGPDAPVKLLFVALYLAGAVWVWSKQEAVSAYAQSVELLSPIMLTAMTHAVAAYLLLGGVALAVLLVYPFGRKATQDQLQSIGLANHAGMAPDLLRKKRDRDNPRVTVWEFRNQSIPLTVWEDKQAAIEAALDVTIIKIIFGKSKSRVLVYAVPTQTSLPEVLRWSDAYLSPDNFVLVLGESLTGPVAVNLANIPHILLGGSTGSGKSVLLKLLLMQALRKGAEVYIADFKGGVDFPKVWRQKCHMCFREDTLLYVLGQLVAVLEARKGWLEEAGCKDLDAFNEATGEGLPRLVFGCDEVAEVLDRTGRSKGDKELLAQIESRLATIARLGRAFGIHLILATQRPDATIIPGQIKNNLDFRVCGRADNILSQIILDNTSAAEQIPKDARGRFILGDGTVFQGYLFDEGQL
ncbi:FtsK/SpoIIIE domain-containing protein [Intestinimonas butyriciproducens]|uniref:FtsK/SpoIIIE domain-containing protein n=1 Tax=Intestinimonas butyriciproducens TaxID=1297617 RepID=UPI00189A142B|nr:FtsK/SpoIIIE domain-containing protein [Intestinimonas butyriciproducens]MCB7512574.1 type IV secretion system DNA-binding domain-containing protein [bacterium 210917-SL.2.15]MDB7831678.1 FtsK/SpoIIIE domain-containing protein [Intestinimonas butyriciproducens]